MEDIKKKIDADIARIGDDWAATFLEQRSRALDQRKISASGSLKESLGYDVQAGAEGAAVRILIAFNDAGRIVEMRRINHDKWGRNAVTRVEDWIRTRGVERFVPGFMKKYQLKNAPKDFINRAAWGILVARSGGRFRRRTWWNKPKSASITNLYNQVALAAIDETAKGVKEAFNFKKYAQAKGRE